MGRVYFKERRDRGSSRGKVCLRKVEKKRTKKRGGEVVIESDMR